MTLIKANRDYVPMFGSFFDDFFGKELGDWRRNNFATGDSTLPSVNIKEDDHGFTVELAAPGMKKDDFKVELDHNVLTISSEKQMEHEEEGKYARKEFSYQAFSRSFTMPDSAELEKINASYKDGLLTLHIPKKEEAKPRPPKTIKIA